jgi:hypothetical protein
MAAGRSNRDGGRTDSKSSPTAASEPVSSETVTTNVTESKVKTDIYHVVGPGSVLIGGKPLPPGELLELTKEEAEKLGAAVALGEPPPKPVPAEKREAGRYRVRGPGSVLKDRIHHQPGTELDLSEDDARSLGDSVEPV